MSARAANHYSPEQILDAGRRAEAEGRTEYALQFYQHLIQHYQGTGPARFAADAVARLDADQPTPLPIGTNGHGTDFMLPPQPRPGYAQDEGSRRTVALSAGEPRREPFELPAPITDYRVARWMARVSTWLGWPMLMIGLGIAAAAIAVPAGMAKLPLIGGMFAGAGTGATIAAAGLAMVIGGQLVRAHLDLALATRNIAALLRVQAAANGGIAEHSDAPRPRKRKRRA